MKNTYILGIFLALGAAILNGSVGIMSKGLFVSNLTPTAVSFYKCLIALIALSMFFLFHSDFRKQVIRLKKHVKAIALCSFLGIFVLYYFETTAYHYAVVPFVVFMLLGSAVFTTFIFSSILLKERKNTLKFVGLFLLIIGLSVMAIAEGAASGQISLGAILACVAGVGYGLFLVLTKKFSLTGGLALIWYLMLFGVFYLSIPFYVEGFTVPEVNTYPTLLALAIFPTIGGFYCTTKALQYLEANKVQFLELTEPIFATVFAFIILRETVQGIEWLGSFLILIAIYISEYSPQEKKQVEAWKDRLWKQKAK
ncbi:DMT family transporter [Bacillus sp. NPDC077027]|uniref:DMT family transporter n=1 Tax=Bacillus sp. NPDC077027 TaxID=3390548 RepID=UPI003D07061F